MEYKFIKIKEKAGGAVTEITLASPPGNILTLGMMRDILQQMKADGQNPHKKLIVFGAEGKHFSFGASVEEHSVNKIKEMLSYFHSFIGSIIKFPVPTLAKVSGLCLGGAFEFVLACTFICADENARFGLPEIELGVFPPPACILLPVRTCNAVGARMILTGEHIEATGMHKYGLLTMLVEKGKLDEAVDDFFEKHLKPKSASSLRLAHMASRVLMADLYEKYIGKIEDLYLNSLIYTNDANEGIKAFIEKRLPCWKDA